VRDRVLPTQSRETAEIPIGRGYAAAMIQRQRRQVCVGNQVPGWRNLRDQLCQDLAVAVRRFGDPDTLAVEPLFHLLPGRTDGFGTSEDAGIGDETKEGQQARPR